MGRSLAMTQFLGHQTRTGGGSQFLRGWRKRSPAEVNVVLHQHAPIVALPLGVRRDDLRRPAEGFGFLVPRDAGEKLLGGLFMSRLFEGRPPVYQIIYFSLSFI